MYGCGVERPKHLKRISELRSEYNLCTLLSKAQKILPEVYLAFCLEQWKVRCDFKPSAFLVILTWLQTFCLVANLWHRFQLLPKKKLGSLSDLIPESIVTLKREKKNCYTIFQKILLTVVSIVRGIEKPWFSFWYIPTNWVKD